MRQYLLVLFILFSAYTFANMASPYQQGTVLSNAFTSKNADILHEKIIVRINQDFTIAHFHIEYRIKTETGGKQIPLLFYAMDLGDDFIVQVDGREIKVTELGQRILMEGNSGRQQFMSKYYMPAEANGSFMKVSWDKNFTSTYRVDDLRFFETELSIGEHTITVDYDASAWTDKKNWIKRTGFRYSLAPAKYWKTFGSLDLVIDASEVKEELFTNLGNIVPAGTKGIFTFTELPADELVISYNPKIKSTARFLLNLGPHILTFIFGSFLFLINLFCVYMHRQKKPAKKRNPFVLYGSLINILLLYIFYVNSYSIIDAALGKEASKYHGYFFLEIIYYPIIFFAYFILLLLADKFLKRKLANDPD